MYKTWNCYLAILLFWLSASVSAQIEDVSIYTEDYPPYNIDNGNGDHTGISIDLLNAVHKELGINKSTKDYNLINWARGYVAIQTPGLKTMLFSTTRSPEREHLFKWAGPITDTTISVFAYKDKPISIHSDADLLPYHYSVIRGGIEEISLKTAGVPVANILLNSRFDQVLNEVKLGRTDLLTYETSAAKWLMKKYGFAVDDFKELYVIRKGQLYYAFNLSVSDETVAAYQKAIDKLTKDPAFMEGIKAKYIK